MGRRWILGRVNRTRWVFESIKERGGCRVVPVLSVPKRWMTGVRVGSAKIFKIGLYPTLIEFYLEGGDGVRASTPYPEYSWHT